MKKIRLLLTLIAVSIGALQGAWARVAPTLPEAQTLTSGQSYYLYNVAEQKFLCQSTTSTSYAAIGTYGDKVTITATENENEYTIQWASDNYYFHAYDTYVYSSLSLTSYGSFTISQSSQGYTIQRSPNNTSYYKSDEFLGYNGSNGDRITPALAEGSIQWQLFSVADAECYMAKHKLFTYLEVADQYNFYVTQYDVVYNNPSSTTAELDLAQSTLKDALDMSQNYVSPSWTEYPILFQNTTENKWTLSSGKLTWNFYKHSSTAQEMISTLTGTVNVDADATLAYSYKGSDYATLRVYMDGELMQIIMPNMSGTTRRYYVEMSAGKHDIAWTCIYNNSTTYTGNYYSHELSEIGVQNTPTIAPATTTTEGQLGTEVLKLVDPVSSVKKIVINGVIGADDWTTIGMMVNAFSIDMSGATATAPMPDNIFNNYNDKWRFLHDVKLPQGLTSIGGSAFYESNVENAITFPSTLATIGNYAFYKSKIKAANMPEGLISVGDYAFCECSFLENATWPSTAVIIPPSCFSRSYNLRTFELPEGLTEIGGTAFDKCSQFNVRLPSTLEYVGGAAFRETSTDSLFIGENVTVLSDAFRSCNNLVYAEWPTSFVYASDYNRVNGVVSDCQKLNKVKLKSPTMVTYDKSDNYYGFLAYNTLSNITLLVPDYLVSAYKLDPYWYQCNVEGFNSADIGAWNVTKALTLNAGQRIGGTPSLNVSLDGSLTINGDDAQTIKNLDINYSPKSYSYSYVVGNTRYPQTMAQQWGMMLGNSDNTAITGVLTEQLRTAEKTWYFLCLPFDTKVGDITATSDATGAATSFAIRYYDGAARANNGTGSNWINYAKDDIIPAGTGFIYQTAQAARSIFVSQNNATKQNVLSNKEFVKNLEANPSEVAANKGWNLVGNPWQTYYNIHKLNFTAPITVWDYSANSGYGNYVAYSIVDDDYAIKPLEAIFVQCPDEIISISFPIDGRQLTEDIESQNAARVATPSERKLIDVELSTGEMNDKTRFVLNPQASLGYELSCDASKFMSMDAAVPQIYTVENGVQLAINERPLGEGTVQLGVKVVVAGEYTITAPRNQFENIVLVDNEIGTETLLGDGASYTFTANAGTHEGRFVLRVGGVVVNGVNAIANTHDNASKYYNLNGQRIAAPQKGLYIVNGKKFIVK